MDSGECFYPYPAGNEAKAHKITKNHKYFKHTCWNKDLSTLEAGAL